MFTGNVCTLTACNVHNSATNWTAACDYISNEASRTSCFLCCSVSWYAEQQSAAPRVGRDPLRLRLHAEGQAARASSAGGIERVARALARQRAPSRRSARRRARRALAPRRALRLHHLAHGSLILNNVYLVPSAAPTWAHFLLFLDVESKFSLVFLPPRLYSV